MPHDDACDLFYYITDSQTASRCQHCTRMFFRDNSFAVALRREFLSIYLSKEKCLNALLNLFLEDSKTIILLIYIMWLFVFWNIFIMRILDFFILNRAIRRLNSLLFIYIKYEEFISREFLESAKLFWIIHTFDTMPINSLRDARDLRLSIEKHCLILFLEEVLFF